MPTKGTKIKNKDNINIKANLKKTVNNIANILNIETDSFAS